jgi:hypothetical protein
MNSIGYPKHIVWSVRAVAIVLYVDYSERSQNHILNISKFKLLSGFDLHEQDLRSMVAVGNFTNKSFDFSVPTQPQNLNLKSATETMEVSVQIN